MSDLPPFDSTESSTGASTSEIVTRTIRREDLGFVVSRVLAVWALVLAVRGISDWAQLFRQLGTADPDNSSHMRQEAGIVGMLAAVWIALAVLLWTKASLFGRRANGSEAASESVPVEAASPIELKQLVSAIMSGFGVILLVSGLAGIASVIQERTDAGPHTVERVLTGTAYFRYWRGDAFEALLGALVFIVYTYGPWFRRVFQYRQD